MTHEISRLGFSSRLIAMQFLAVMAALFFLSGLESAHSGDWPRLLGSGNDLCAAASDAKGFWPESGLRQVWEFPKGKGWAPPSVVGGKVFLFHRDGAEEVLECLSLDSGKSIWRVAYDAPYRDRYGSGDAPRTGPVVSEGKVWTFGITGILHCVELGSGKVLWKRDLGAEYQMGQNFFGHGSTPLVMDRKVIVPIGGSSVRCVVALSTTDGSEVWVARHAWGAGYASPISGKFGSGEEARDCVLIFAGGECRPATGGLLCINAKNGKVLGEVPHRARIPESVNAASPVMVGGDQVFTTEAYGSGGVLSRIEADGTLRKVWGTVKLGSHFGTPLAKDGLILGFDGQNPRLAELVCLDAVSGEEKWRDDLGGSFGRGSLVNLGEEGVLALGEFGELVRMKCGPKGLEVLQRARLFEAPETWGLPVLSERRLLVMQNARSRDGKEPRLICYRY
ncbi:MAG: PQQ-binding-like beta-propeller repeat protein [Verrucomicrobiota bacterium]